MNTNDRILPLCLTGGLLMSLLFIMAPLSFRMGPGQARHRDSADGRQRRDAQQGKAAAAVP